MKKIILSALVAVCALTANAQAWMGGSAGFGITDYENADKSQIDLKIAPEIGYSLNEKWDVAIGLGFAETNNYLGVEDANTTTFTVEPYARYTFAKAGIASFFIDGGIGFGSVKPKDVDATTTFSIGLCPGFKVALSDDVSLVTRIGKFGYETVKDTYNKFGFGIDNTKISFGLYWNL